MRLRLLSDPRWLTCSFAEYKLRDRIRLHVTIFGVSLVWLILVYTASTIDGTTTLDGVGKGFLEHGGYIALHLATPVALSLALIALECFTKLMGRLKEFIRPPNSIELLEDCRSARLSVVNLHSRWTWLLLLFVAVGALFTTLVLIQVIDPVATYGNDVFNACRYPFGYYVANIYLALSGIVIFPFTLFIILQITASLVVILGEARQQQILAVDLLHQDNCGGLSAFGDLNLWLMLYYVPPFLAMSALGATHARKYASLLIPAVALSLVFVVQSIVTVYAIHLAVRDEKRARLAGLRETLDQALHHPTAHPAREITFLLWQHVRGVKTMPYAANVSLLVSALRYIPPCLAIYNIIKAQP